MKNLIYRNIYYFATVLFLLIIGGVILLASSKADVTIWVNSHYNYFTDCLFLIVNQGGEIWFSAFIIFAILIFNGWNTALKAVSCFVATFFVVYTLKYLIFPGELRPTLYFDGIYTLRLLDGVVQLQTESFPSGHSAAAFSVATFLALFLPKKQWHWLLALAAASVAYARLYLSQHFITDVYTGMTIGVIVTTLVFYLFPDKNKTDEKAD